MDGGERGDEDDARPDARAHGEHGRERDEEHAGHTHGATCRGAARPGGCGGGGDGGANSSCAKSSGKARETAPAKAATTCASTSHGPRPRSTAARCASGHPATTQQSSVCDHHQPTALSLTSTYASTKRLGGSGWYAYFWVCATKKRRISRHVWYSANAAYGSASRMSRARTGGRPTSRAKAARYGKRTIIVTSEVPKIAK